MDKFSKQKLNKRNMTTNKRNHLFAKHLFALVLWLEFRVRVRLFMSQLVTGGSVGVTVIGVR